MLRWELHTTSPFVKKGHPSLKQLHRTASVLVEVRRGRLCHTHFQCLTDKATLGNSHGSVIHLSRKWNFAQKSHQKKWPFHKENTSSLEERCGRLDLSRNLDAEFAKKVKRRTKFGIQGRQRRRWKPLIIAHAEAQKKSGDNFSSLNPVRQCRQMLCSREASHKHLLLLFR